MSGTNIAQRGVTSSAFSFLDLVRMTRVEAGRSSNPAMGVNDQETVKYVINRTQQELYFKFDWPGNIVDRDVLLIDGGRYYDYPADLQFEDINVMWVLVNTVYDKVEYGIGPAEWRIWNSDQGFKSWPTQKWLHNPDMNKFELWPVPDGNAQAQASYVRMRGTRTVAPLINDSDMCVINGYLLALYAAAELLARDGSKDAGLKLTKAEGLRHRMGVRQTSHKRRPFIMGGGGDGGTSFGRIGLDYIPPGYGSGPVG